MALLRIPMLASQVEPSRAGMLESAGETASLLRQQKYDEVFRRFDALLKTYPETPYLHYAYGTALQTFSHFDDAQKQFSEEIRVTPQSPLPHLRLAQLALTQHRVENAIVSARRAIELDPDSGGGHELLGRALLESGKVQDAIRELEAANRLAPTYPEVHFDLARAYAKAKMSAEAERERAIFAEMSANVEGASAHRDGTGDGAPGERSNSGRIVAKPVSDPH
jgi:predicted Zn-dependent protease